MAKRSVSLRKFIFGGWAAGGSRFQRWLAGPWILLVLFGVMVLWLCWLLYQNVWVVLTGEVVLPAGVQSDISVIDTRLLEQVQADRQQRLRASPPPVTEAIRRALP